MNEQTIPTPEAVEETPSEAQSMSDVYDRLMAESEPEQSEPEAGEPSEQPARDEHGRFVAKEAAEEPVEEAPEPVEAAPEEVAEEVAEEEETPEDAAPEVPTYLPAELRKQWGDIPEKLREPIAKAHREMGNRLAEQGRQMQAVAPVFQKVVEAANAFPQMRDMTPAQIATDVFELARVQASLAEDPVGTILQVAERYGAMQGLQERLAGADKPSEAATINQQLVRKIEHLERQLSENLNPAKFEETIQRTLATRETEAEVASFAAKHPHWKLLEPHLPNFVREAKAELGDSASNSDVLTRAYQKAATAHGLRASDQGVSTPAQPDPKRTQAVIKAKAANVKSRGAGNPKPLTEREAMSAAYDRLMGS